MTQKQPEDGNLNQPRFEKMNPHVSAFDGLDDTVQTATRQWIKPQPATIHQKLASQWAFE